VLIWLGGTARMGVDETKGGPMWQVGMYLYSLGGINVAKKRRIA
jgi:hypothetical protein